MASISSETSYWIKFLTEAGIPAGDAAHYAILFADNRISKDMMLDLSKEYLKDMGVTRLGDVIAILKHAQKVHNQEAKDMILRSSNLSLRSSSPSVNSNRRSTAASRMVNHITSKHPAASPMSQLPVPRPVSPDPPSTKRKVSVFERLGAEGGDVTVSVPKLSPESSGNTVFSRLGGKTPVKRPASSTSASEFDNDRQSLPYVGVLKSPGSGSPSPVRKKKRVAVIPAVTMTPVKPKFQINSIKKTISSSNVTISNIQRPEVSTSTEGVLSAFAKKGAPSLRDRLGSKTELPSSTTTLGMDKAKNKAKLTKIKASVQNRLGAKKEDQSSSSVVSSTQQINVKLKKAKEISMRSAKQDSQKVTGVFSRLGKKSKV